jgi:uncharacterized protein YeaC (DUF1315 family)
MLEDLTGNHPEALALNMPMRHCVGEGLSVAQAGSRPNGVTLATRQTQKALQQHSALAVLLEFPDDTMTVTLNCFVVAMRADSPTVLFPCEGGFLR